MSKSKHILIADDDDQFVDALARRCQMLGALVARAYDGASALQQIDETFPDLVILDVNMPRGNGLNVCEMIRRDPELNSIPIVMLTGRKDGQTIQSCHEQLGYYVPKGPDVWLQLRPLIVELLGLDQSHVTPLLVTDDSGAQLEKRSVDDEPSLPAGRCAQALRPDFPKVDIYQVNKGPAKEAPRTELIDAVFSALGWQDTSPSNPSTDFFPARPWVLCIDDDLDFAAVLKLRLRQFGVDVLQAYAGMSGYRNAINNPAQAIILDYELPDGKGDYVLRRLKENPITKDIPVIVLTGRNERALERKMYNLGAVRFFAKPVVWEELWEELRNYVQLAPQSVGA
jgi:CheY-like chemotaxis protein